MDAAICYKTFSFFSFVLLSFLPPELFFSFNAVKKYNDSNWPAVLYIHPREVDPQGPRLKLPALKRFASYGNRRDVSQRLLYLFERYSFSTMREIYTPHVKLHTDSGL